MKKVYYRKLIRDKIPEIIKQRGSDFKVTSLKPAKYDRELFRKVGEETGELLVAKTKREIISELADVFDVLAEIQKVKKITSTQINQVRKQNFHRKGGFAKRLFLIWSADDGYKTGKPKNTR